MTAVMRFRAAEPGDVDAVVPLMHDASRDPIDSVFEVRPGAAGAFLRHDFLRGRGIFGYRNQLVGVDQSGTVVAAATVYEGSRYRRLSAHTTLSATTHFGPRDLITVVRRTNATADRFVRPWPGTVYLGNFGVSPQHRSKGYGTQLIEQTIAYANARGIEAVELDVALSNNRAQELYLRTGFVVTDECTVRRGQELVGTRRMTRVLKDFSGRAED